MPRLAIVITLLILWISSGCQKPAPESPSIQVKPNVILIITDDQGYGDIGAHGNTIIQTPYMDQLHARSVRFTDFHVNPTCSPSRAALMTGRNANRTGVWHTIAGRSQLRKDEVTLAQVFSQNDYRTAIFGKWHLGDNYPFRPQDRGFEEVLIHGGGGVGQQPDFWGNDYFNDTYWYNGKPKPFTGYCTDVWFEQAIEFIDRQKEQPFFCYISTNAPHSPFWVEDKYSQKYEQDSNVVSAPFYGMIDNIDYNLGKLMNYLSERELEQNTLLIFMSDNGTAGGAAIDRVTKHTTKGYNAGMRGTKNTPYEGGHRVPFFMYWPQGGLHGGRDIHTLSAHMDVMPTLIDLLQLDYPDSLKFDGISLKSELTGTPQLEGQRTLIIDSQREETPQKWKQSSIMNGKWRLINGNELYDVGVDPGQNQDLAANHPQIEAQLKDEYERWWSDLQPTFDNYAHTIIGSDAEPKTILYVHDMHLQEDYNSTLPWHQNHVRAGTTKSLGWWPVKFAEGGKYRFKLYRWPAQLQVPITSGVEAIKGEVATNVEGYQAGVAISINEVTLQFGSVNSAVTFELEVEPSTYDLRAWFEDDSDEAFAVNYVEIERLD